jgi:hypothetical protein
LRSYSRAGNPPKLFESSGGTADATEFVEPGEVPFKRLGSKCRADYTDGPFGFFVGRKRAARWQKITFFFIT